MLRRPSFLVSMEVVVREWLVRRLDAEVHHWPLSTQPDRYALLAAVRLYEPSADEFNQRFLPVHPHGTVLHGVFDVRQQRRTQQRHDRGGPSEELACTCRGDADGEALVVQYRTSAHAVRDLA